MIAAFSDSRKTASIRRTVPAMAGNRILRSHFRTYELFVQSVYSGRLPPILGTFTPCTRDDYYTRDVIFRREYEKRDSNYHKFSVVLGTFTPYTRDDYCKRPELAGAFLYQNWEKGRKRSYFTVLPGEGGFLRN